MKELKQPRIRVSKTGIAKTAGEPRCSINNLLKRGGQLSEHSKKSLKHALESIFVAGTSGAGVNDHVLFLTEQSEVSKSLLQSIFGKSKILKDPVNIDPETMELMLKILLEMMSIEYQVIILNGTDQSTAPDDLVNLTVMYFENSYAGGKTVTRGPFTKSLAALPPGETADFHLCPCLFMVNKYAVQFTFQGNPYSITEDIDTLNQEEKATYGSIDYCGDSLEVYFE